MTPKTLLSDACPEGKEWAKGSKTLKAMWETCQRPDWMLWGLGQIGYSDDRVMRLYACACVRGTPAAKGTVWDLLTDKRSKNAVEVAERFAEGKATVEERDAAGAAAGDATRAAWDAGDAAWAARAAARDAAGDAAWAAARAAWAAGDAARAAAWAWQADKLREMLPWSEVEKVIKSRERKPPRPS